MVISIISLVNLVMTDVVHLSAFLSAMFLPWDNSASFFFRSGAQVLLARILSHTYLVLQLIKPHFTESGFRNP